jgi:hypothetical protein
MAVLPMGKRTRRRHQRPPKTLPNPAPKPEEKLGIPKWVLYIRNAGGGLAVVSFFPLIWFPEFCWYGVVFLIAGFALHSLEALREEWKRHWRIFSIRRLAGSRSVAARAIRIRSGSD